MEKCHYCDNLAEATSWSPEIPLCLNHFNRYMEKKVESTLKNVIYNYHVTLERRRLLVALSGGKDSMALLHLLHSLSLKYHYTLMPLIIDLGLPHLHDGITVCKKNCRNLGLELQIYDLKSEEGFTIPELIEIDGHTPCSICGLIKRYILNKIAVEHNSIIVMGHTLNDYTYRILRALSLGDMDTLRRLSYILSQGKRMAMRFSPLHDIYEIDICTFLRINGIEYSHAICPYNDFRIYNPYRRIMDSLDEIDHGVLRRLKRTFFRRLKPTAPKVNLRECKICGYPTTSEICLFCRIKNLWMKRKAKA